MNEQTESAPAPPANETSVPCCPPEVQATCCQPAEKSGCCGDVTVFGTCRCQ
jgi:hypothetical protein